MNLESKQILLEIESGLEKVVIAKACNFITKETLPQVFSCEFCEISKNPFFRRIPLVAASVKGVAKEIIPINQFNLGEGWFQQFMFGKCKI